MSIFVPKQKQIPTQYSTKKWNWSGTEAPLRKKHKKTKIGVRGTGRPAGKQRDGSPPLSVQTPSHHPVQGTVCCRLAACRSTTLQDEEHGQKGDFEHSAVRSQPPRNQPGRFPCPPPRPAARRCAPPRTEPRWGTWRGEPPAPRTHLGFARLTRCSQTFRWSRTKPARCNGGAEATSPGSVPGRARGYNPPTSRAATVTSTRKTTALSGLAGEGETTGGNRPRPSPRPVPQRRSEGPPSAAALPPLSGAMAARPAPPPPRRKPHRLLGKADAGRPPLTPPKGRRAAGEAGPGRAKPREARGEAGSPPRPPPLGGEGGGAMGARTHPAAISREERRSAARPARDRQPCRVWGCAGGLGPAAGARAFSGAWRWAGPFPGRAVPAGGSPRGRRGRLGTASGRRRAEGCRPRGGSAVWGAPTPSPAGRRRNGGAGTGRRWPTSPPPPWGWWACPTRPCRSTASTARYAGGRRGCQPLPAREGRRGRGARGRRGSLTAFPFCQTTGLGGTTGAGHSSEQIESMEPVRDRVIRVTFNADVHSSIQWNFKPQQSEIYVSDFVFALAQNRSHLEVKASGFTSGFCHTSRPDGADPLVCVFGPRSGRTHNWGRVRPVRSRSPFRVRV